MSSVATSILNDLAGALNAGNKFELVTVGGAGSSTAIPRADVAYEGRELFKPDDSPTQRWVRLRARVTIRIRSNDPAEAVSKLADLCESAAETILSDRFRSGLTCDLPIGVATEILSEETSYAIKRPESQGSLSVNCHYQIEVS